jgi:hypothetical protein
LESGVRVDILVEGAPLPREGAGAYPSPHELGASARDPDVVDLQGLIELKLRARRHQDIADIVALLQQLDDAHFLELEAGVERSLRPALTCLREDAIEELRISQ